MTAFLIPGFTPDYSFSHSGFYKFRLFSFLVLQIPFRVLQIPDFLIPVLQIPGEFINIFKVPLIGQSEPQPSRQCDLL
jgi:hypothetical protein